MAVTAEDSNRTQTSAQVGALPSQDKQPDGHATSRVTATTEAAPADVAAKALAFDQLVNGLTAALAEVRRSLLIPLECPTCMHGHPE